MALRLAIVGTGWAGCRQAEAVGELDGSVELAAFSDSDEQALREAAERFGVGTVSTDYSQLLADPRIDAVSICLPHALHADAAIQAAQAGKHVLCEKPIALTVAEGIRMRDAAQAAAVKLYVAENAVYTDETRALQALVGRTKEIGDVVFVTVVRGFRTTRYAYDGRRAWLARPELGGTGTLMLHGIHTVAQIRAVVGEIRSVSLTASASPRFENRDVEGSACGTLVTAAGYPVLLAQTCESDLPGETGGWVVYGNQGTARAHGETVELVSRDGIVPYDYTPPDRLSSYARELESFARHVAGSDGPTDADSELRSLAVVEAGYESIRTGRSIDLVEKYPTLYR